MNKLTVNILSFAFLALAVVAAALLGSEAKVKPEVKFSHRLHAEDVGVECKDCHPGVAESKSGADDLLPTMEQCAACHAVENTDECSKCHTDVDKPRPFERVAKYSPKFNHAKHLERGVACETCHDQIAKADTAGTEKLPVMEACVKCHDGMQAEKACIACHENPKGKLPADHHSALWSKQHGDEAKLDDARSCAMCHERNDCQECHQGDNLGRPRAHPPGFESKHPLEFRSGRTECSACHDERSFCAECHLERNVYPRSHQRASWANPVSGGAHRLQAEANIEQCVVCHSDEPGNEPVCAACHQGKSEQ